MKLTATELLGLSHGALGVGESEGYVSLYRFSETQREYYQQTNPHFFEKALATASVRLETVTDATAMCFSYRAKKTSGRTFCYFDLLVDGVLSAHVGKEIEGADEGTVTLPLPEGTHRVALYFPALFEVRVKDVVLEGATFALPVQKSLSMLALGDSITQGYDAVYPSLSYANVVADTLGATLLNQAIGGEVFNPGVVDGHLGFTPDMVTVAYGTNDYTFRKKEEIKRDAAEFYARVRRAYPTSKIFAILPIWRADCDAVTEAGSFEEVRLMVRAAAEAEGLTVLDGLSFVPHLPDFFSDGYLHPNDLGFGCYAKALLSDLKKHLA